jgi:hypothetical protein
MFIIIRTFVTSLLLLYTSLLLMILKVYCEISVLLGLVQNFEFSDLVIRKLEKINIAVT